MIHTTHHDPDITVIRPGMERLTAANATGFKADVIALIDAGHSQLVLDFSTVSFLDSSGLGALVGVLKKIGHRGDLLVCSMSEDVAHMFKVCRMDRVFSMHRDVNGALQDLRERA